MKAVLTLLLTLALFASPDAWATKADLVVVNKTERKLYLFKDDEIIGEYMVAFGSNPEGHKIQEGDGRTPEGRYVLDWKNPNSAYYLSIHVSYPNRDDRARARLMGVDPGGDIMIHGQKNGYGWLGQVSRFVNWTDGCIAVSDADMDEIWAAVDPGTPIEIRP